MRKFVTAALCLLLPTAAAAQARPVGSAPGAIEPAARHANIDSLTSALERLHTSPDAHGAEASWQPAGTPAADSTAILEAALDYIEGWYEGDATRMRRALHPDLAKRIVQTPAGGTSRLGHMSAGQLIIQPLGRRRRAVRPEVR